MDCVRMRQSGFDWSIVRTNLYLLNQLMKAGVDCCCIWPIISQYFLTGGSLSWRGGVYEVIQSLSDSLCRRVWGRVVGVRSRRAVVHLQTLFGTETPLKIFTTV